ncbi:MAG: flagellar export chaperone FliS [Thermodesulfobacteriota bacterium]
MTYGAAARSYVRTQIETNTDPNQLVLLLYDGAIRFLEQARSGCAKEDRRRRGEGLSRAIAIIGELNASLNVEAGGETATFLRSLYLAMLAELPKVNLANDVTIIDRCLRYLTELRELWVSRVLGRETAAVQPVAAAKPEQASLSLSV